MAPRAGLYVQSERLTFAAIVGKGLEYFSLEPGDNPGAQLKAELGARRLACRRVRLALDRSMVTVKTIDLPAVAGANRREMLRFEIDRHVPFVAEDLLLDAIDLPAAGDGPGPVHVLIAAAERKLLDRALRITGESGLRPASLTVACHDLLRLVGRQIRGGRVVWAHRCGGATDLVFVGSGQLRGSRSVVVEQPEDLVGEVNATLRVLRWKDCEAVWISGDGAVPLLTSTALGELGAPATAPPLTPTAASLAAQLPPDERGLGLLALAAAAGRRQPPLNLLPEAMRPHVFTVAQAATVGVAVLTAGLALASLTMEGHRDRRYLKDLETAAVKLEPEVRAVNQVVAELGGKKRLLSAIKAVEQSGLHPLPLMRELTDVLPQDAWLSTLNLDAKSVEISGQANAASQLIPLLEGSAWLERVEFTSPVTRGRDKEQFRIKAALEAGPGGPVSGPAGRPAPPGGAPAAGRAARPGGAAGPGSPPSPAGSLPPAPPSAVAPAPPPAAPAPSAVVPAPSPALPAPVPPAPGGPAPLRPGGKAG
jgi:Tfp pilus assembly protein PilN